MKKPKQTIRIETEGLVLLRHNSKYLLEQIDEMKPNFSVLSRKTSMPIATAWDSWHDIARHNDIEVVIRIKAKIKQTERKIGKIIGGTKK